MALFAAPTHLHRLTSRKSAKDAQARKNHSLSAHLPLCPADPHGFGPANAASLCLSHPNSGCSGTELCFYLLPAKVSLAKQHERKQGGVTHGGRDWRSKLIPHAPQVETFQAASASSGAGGVQQTLRAPRRTFPHFSPTHCCALNPHGSI